MHSVIDVRNFTNNNLGGIVSTIRSIASVDIHSVVMTQQSSVNSDHYAKNLLDESGSLFTTLASENSWVLFSFPARKLFPKEVES